ncbi:hypothetical protein GmHk_15G044114 [Glycine max]|nr:hypothetical protein GmHk_15G044114 [Glycine max]
MAGTFFLLKQQNSLEIMSVINLGTPQLVVSEQKLDSSEPVMCICLYALGRSRNSGGKICGLD